MGHDYISYEGRHELFNDFDLWMLRHFCIEEARVIEAAWPTADATRLREFFERWDWPGPGVFTGTDFTEYVSLSRARRELLLHLLQRVGDRIAAFGELIPLDYLSVHVSTPTASFTVAQPARNALENVGRICALLSKQKPQSD